jgi:uncharacterized membrane protein
VAYNTGSEDDRRSALRAIADLTKIQMSLSTGAILVSATFLNDFYNDKGLPLLMVSWLLFVISIVFGFFALGQYISQLAESEIKPRRSALEWLNLAQWVGLAAALVLFAIFVILNVTAETQGEKDETAALVSRLISG